MIAIIAGFALATTVNLATGLKWPLMIIFWGIGLTLQVIYARRMYAFFGGADPVATYHVKNFKQLKAVVPISIDIRALYFLTRTMWWSGIATLFISVDWLVLS